MGSGLGSGRDRGWLAGLAREEAGVCWLSKQVPGAVGGGCRAAGVPDGAVPPHSPSDGSLSAGRVDLQGCLHVQLALLRTRDVKHALYQNLSSARALVPVPTQPLAQLLVVPGAGTQHSTGELGRTGLLRAKSPSPELGLALSPLRLPPGRAGARLAQGPRLFALHHHSRSEDKIHLFIQVELYSFTSVLATSCVFGTCLEWRVAGGFGSPPGIYKRRQA